MSEAMIARLAATTMPTAAPGADAGISAAMEQITLIYEQYSVCCCDR